MTPSYIHPRRFAEVWEFDRNGPPFCGTLEQQRRVRSWFDRNLVHGNGLHRTLQALDHKANAMGWSFYLFTFADDDRFNPWANSTRVRIQFYMDPQSLPGQEWFDYVVPHELGHVIGWNLLNPIDRSEQWAEDFRLWILTGSPAGSPVQRRLLENA